MQLVKLGKCAEETHSEIHLEIQIQTHIQIQIVMNTASWPNKANVPE